MNLIFNVYIWPQAVMLRIKKVDFGLNGSQKVKIFFLVNSFLNWNNSCY